jgi:hypothetical protein
MNKRAGLYNDSCRSCAACCFQQRPKRVQTGCARLTSAELPADVLQGQGCQAHLWRDTIWNRTPLKAPVQLEGDAVRCESLELKVKHVC